MKIIQPFQYLIAVTTINNIDTSNLNKFAKKILASKSCTKVPECQLIHFLKNYF